MPAVRRHASILASILACARWVPVRSEEFCDSEGQCLGGHCVWSPDGSVCSIGCDNDDECPENWSCRVYGNDRRACFINSSPDDSNGMGGSGQGGSGGGSMGGAGGMAGDPGFPVVPDNPNMEERDRHGPSSFAATAHNGQSNPMNPMTPKARWLMQVRR